MSHVIQAGSCYVTSYRPVWKPYTVEANRYVSKFIRLFLQKQSIDTKSKQDLLANLATILLMINSV